MLAFSRQWAKWLLRKMYITHVCSLQRVINCAIMAMKLGFLEIHLKLQKNKTLALEGDRVCFLETVGPNPLSDVERRWIPSTKRAGDREGMQPFQQDYSCLPPHALLLSITISKHFWKAHGVKLIKKVRISVGLWDLNSRKPLLLLRQFPLLLHGYLCRDLSLSPGSSLCQQQGLPVILHLLSAILPVGPLPKGSASLWCFGKTSSTPAWSALASSAAESFHAVCYTLLFISDPLPPHC